MVEKNGCDAQKETGRFATSSGHGFTNKNGENLSPDLVAVSNQFTEQTDSKNFNERDTRLKPSRRGADNGNSVPKDSRDSKPLGSRDSKPINSLNIPDTKSVDSFENTEKFEQRYLDTISVNSLLDDPKENPDLTQTQEEKRSSTPQKSKRTSEAHSNESPKTLNDPPLKSPRAPVGTFRGSIDPKYFQVKELLATTQQDLETQTL